MNIDIINNIDVPNQYEYESISYNQCSWFCIEFIINLKNNNWEINLNDNLIKDIYINSLINASNKRKDFGKLSWGESLFSKTIHSMNNYSLDIIKIRKCLYNKENKEKNLIYIDEMKSIQNYKDNLENINFLELCKNINGLFDEKKYVMINRFGQSFIIFPYSRETYLIFDSHKTFIIELNFQNVINYILENPSSFNFIIYIECKISKNNTCSRIQSILFDDSN